MAKRKIKRTKKVEEAPSDPHDQLEANDPVIPSEPEAGPTVTTAGPLPTPPEAPVEPEATPEPDKDEDRRARLVQKSPADRVPIIDTRVPDFDPINQKLFEAPDGHIMVGGIGDARMWYPKCKMFINPRHERLSVDERARRALARSRKDEQE